MVQSSVKSILFACGGINLTVIQLQVCTVTMLTFMTIQRLANRKKVKAQQEALEMHLMPHKVLMDHKDQDSAVHKADHKVSVQLNQVQLDLVHHTPELQVMVAHINLQAVSVHHLYQAGQHSAHHPYQVGQHSVHHLYQVGQHSVHRHRLMAPQQLLIQIHQARQDLVDRNQHQDLAQLKSVLTLHHQVLDNQQLHTHTHQVNFYISLKNIFVF